MRESKTRPMERKKYVIVMAAGSGTRMGCETPKQFLEIDGKAILRRSIEVFLEACPDVTVVTVLQEPYVDSWKKYCLSSGFLCPQIIAKGGITRFHSVKNALARIPDGAVVAVHDGVRPLVTSELVERMYRQAETVPALIPVVPCVDTMKLLDKKKTGAGAAVSLYEIEGAKIDREQLYAAQTPQMFHSEILREAYSMPYDMAFTDDASVVSAYGQKLSFTIGERFNIKITAPDDLVIAEAVVGMRKN